MMKKSNRNKINVCTVTSNSLHPFQKHLLYDFNPTRSYQIHLNQSDGTCHQNHLGIGYAF